MRYLIIIGLIVGLHHVASATCYTPQQCTVETATTYLGGAPWDVLCKLEAASWDPQVKAFTCVAHSASLETIGGVAYVEMEYATSTAEDGSVWPYLPMWATYWWPQHEDAKAWLTGYSIIDAGDWALQDARITWTYHRCGYDGFCEGFINYDLDPGQYYIYCSWYWSSGDIFPHVTCRVGQGAMR